jgi:hypothetical protein
VSATSGQRSRMSSAESKQRNVRAGSSNPAPAEAGCRRESVDPEHAARGTGAEELT